MGETATLEISEARKHLNGIDERLKTDRVIYVTRHGKPVFAFVDFAYWSEISQTVETLKDPDVFKMVVALKSFLAIQNLRLPQSLENSHA